MKTFIKLHKYRYPDGGHCDDAVTDPILINVFKISMVYNQAQRVDINQYINITIICIDGAEYQIKESYDAVVGMIEEAMSDNDHKLNSDNTEA